MISVTRLPFSVTSQVSLSGSAACNPPSATGSVFTVFFLRASRRALGILRVSSLGGEHVAHPVCMARKESVECVEVEFLPSATDGGEHTFTSGMGDQRAPLPVPLANLLFKVPFFFARVWRVPPSVSRYAPRNLEW